MKKLIIVSKSYAYQNMTTCLLIDDYIENVEVVLFSEENKEQIMNKMVQEGFELVFIESGVLSFFPDFSSLPDSIKLFGYSEKGKEADIELFEPLGIATIGTFNLASDIVHYVDEFSEETIKSLSVKEDSKAKSPVIGEQKTEQRIETPKTQDKTPEKDDEFCIFCPECGTQLKAYSKFCYNCGKKIGEISVTEEISERVTENDLAKAETEEIFGVYSSVYKKKCKVIATYSAKGGVGKTTVATNLAAMLAMTTTGRRNTRVCIVDYNVDFGDVLTSLGFDQKKTNMMAWVADIGSRIDEGEEPNSIQYSKSEIESRFLQKKVYPQKVYSGNVEIYALIAPIEHEDSMEIEDKALSLMLENLKENGDFDYIICDTGNNTRDSSVIALEMADNVLLINTQDVTTVNDNDNFLRTMEHFSEFNKDKILLVINNVVATKEIGISVKDIEDVVPFTCVARIKRDNHIGLSSNKGTPEVFNTNSQMYKEMLNIVSVITKDDELQINTKKKSLFGFLRRK